MSADVLSAFPSIDRYAFAIVQASRLPSHILDGLDLQTIVPEQFLDQADLFPALIDLNKIDGRQWESLVSDMRLWESTSDSPCLSALLSTDCTSTQVASHIARRMVVRRSVALVDVLRYYDPYVFRHLRWLLTTAQIDSLLGPVTHWSWREPDGGWQEHSRSIPHASVPPLLLDKQQWSTLTRIADINAVLRKLSRAVPSIEYNESTAREIDDLLVEAQQRFQLRDPLDQRLFAEQSLTFHRRIHTHPQMVDRLASVGTRQWTYVRACSDLCDEQLRAMGAELDSNNLEVHK